jgi:hypothetical protein
MKHSILKICVIGAALLLPVLAWSQTDPFGKIDTVYADVAKIDSNVWTITISYTNDEPVVGLSIPLKYSSKLVKLIADSAIYAGGRVTQFEYRGFRVDTAIQCLTLGMIAYLGPTHIELAPGSGRLVTIYVSSIDDIAIPKLMVDTTTTHPDNSLLAVTASLIGTPPDTVRVDEKKKQLIPAFVVRQAKR